MDTSSPAQLPERFRLIRQLGQGGQARVWLALDRDLDRRVALRQTAAAETEFARRASLRHPSIAAVLDFDAGASLLVEEFVDGEAWTTTEPWETRDVITAARCLLAALTCLHEHGVVHRDIKPENLIVQAGLPVLIDFGLATDIASATSSSGTLGTVAPELLAGTADPRRADLFALGCTLLAATLGCAPDPRWSLEPETLRRQLDSTPIELRSLLVGLCSEDPSHRFGSAAAAVVSIPHATTIHTPPEAWPLAERETLIASCVAKAGTNKAAFCVFGEAGSGRRSIAERLARELRSRGRHTAVVTEPDSERAFELHTALGAMHGGDVLIVTTSQPAVRSWLTAVVPPQQLHEVTSPPLTLDAIRDLSRWLPWGDDVDPDAVFAGSLGHPGTIARLMGTTRVTRDDPGAAEVYVAVRGERIAPSELADDREPALADFERAAAEGRLRRERDGCFTLPSPESERLVREATPPAERRAMHAIVAERVPAVADYHRAAAGDAARLPAGLAALARTARSGHPRLAAARLVELTDLAGRDAVCVATSELADLGRELVRASQLDAVMALFPALVASDDGALLALASYLQSEHGDVEQAVALARRAIARDPDLPAAAHLDLARALQFAGSWNEALEACEAARRQAHDARDHVAVTRIESLVRFRLGQVEKARHLAERGIDALGDERSPLWFGLVQNLAMIERHRGSHARAARLFETAARGLLELGDVRAAAIVWINSGIAWQDAGCYAKSQALREQAEQKCELTDLAQPRDVAAAGVGIALLRRGAWPAAERKLDAAAASLAAQGLRREAWIARCYAREAAVLLGDASGLHELETALDEALAEAMHAEAAIAWRILLAAGRDPQETQARARAMLRSCDRATREAIRVELHARRRTARSRSRLEHLAATGLPRTRLLANEALARQPGEQRRQFIARALKAGARLESPADRLRIGMTAMRYTQSPQLHARRILRHLAELETIHAHPGGDSHVDAWTTQIEALRAAVEPVLAQASQETVEASVVPFVELNRLLLDPSIDDDSRYRRILEVAIDLTSAWRGMVIARTRRGGDMIRLSLSRQTDARGLEEVSFEYSHSLIDEVLETRQPRVTVNALEDPEWQRAASVIDFKLASIACVPLCAGNDVLGALYLDNPFERGRFRTDSVILLEALGTQVSLCLAAARRRSEIERLNADLEGRLHDATDALAAVHERDGVLYNSDVMARVMKQVRRLAATDLPVHVHGETGTGKELVARRIHELSSRRSGPFVSENCSAIAGEILESELFGHVQGAFTGAVRDKPGLLRMADGGTLFLDEIGDMPLALQTRLLRVLQEGEVRPVGGDRVVKVDVRIVTATHRDVSKMIADGEFREDLYYRCVVTRVDLPPLRDRREDIELLARHFLTRYGSDDSCFAPAALEALSACDWPGNIRELESAVRSAIVMARGDAIEVTDLPQSVQSPVAPQRSGGIPTTNLKELERLALERALLETNGNRAEAAKLLGISRSSVFVKIREFGLS